MSRDRSALPIPGEADGSAGHVVFRAAACPARARCVMPVCCRVIREYRAKTGRQKNPVFSVRHVFRGRGRVQEGRASGLAWLDSPPDFGGNRHPAHKAFHRKMGYEPRGGAHPAARARRLSDVRHLRRARGLRCGGNPVPLAVVDNETACLAWL